MSYAWICKVIQFNKEVDDVDILVMYELEEMCNAMTKKYEKKGVVTKKEFKDEIWNIYAHLHKPI